MNTHATNNRILDYLTKWKYQNPSEYEAMFGDVLVCNLTPEEYTALFNHVVQNDLKYLTA